MKVTLNWLKKYVGFEGSTEELVERLTMLGMEVEGVEEVVDPLAGVVVAEVLEKQQHPDADRLSVCKVADGTGERQIVCGAKNFEVGSKVPLILPGASLPTEGDEKPFVIKVGKLRGVESQGMMCSPKELKLAGDADGLMLLPDEAKVGMPLSEHLGRSAGDVMIDLEITPNRPDLNSALGVAREIAADQGRAVCVPNPNPTASGEKVEDLVAVRIEDPELCPRYSARVIKGVQVGPSPAWLQESLERVGLRSVNNVVDVTNFVMLELGQPLHAFDYHLLQKRDGEAKPTIVVRRATDGEIFTTLDEQERTLDSEMLVIADETRAIALAGVMGGLNSEIKDTTTDVLIESATFNATNIRRTSKTLGLRTDASYRYERGVDVEVADLASRRAAELILETAGGALADGVVDNYPTPHEPTVIQLRFARTDNLLGIKISPEEQTRFLKSLEIEPVGAPSSEVGDFRVPSFRSDLKGEIDLIEEITRMYGVDKIPGTAPRGARGSHAFDATFDHYEEVRSALIGLGFDEAQGQTLISKESAKLVDENPIPLAYPLSQDMDVLRPSLMPGLLDSLRNNVVRNVDSCALFELGRVFNRDAEGATQENWRLAMVLSGRAAPIFWQGEDRDRLYDIHDLKGAMEEFLETIGAPALQATRDEKPGPLFVQSATFGLGKLGYGRMGQVHPILGKRYDFRSPVFLLELDIDNVLNKRKKVRKLTPLPSFPSVRRDVAMLVDEALTHQDITRVAQKAKIANLVHIELFDVFRGTNIPEGKKSVAYQFTYRHDERTLTDKEVTSAHEKLVEKLTSQVGAQIR